MRRPGERPLPGKLTVRVGQRKHVFAKGAGDSERHVLLKALLFARYVGPYPDLLVERNIGQRYKPDLVVLGSYQSVRFWAEGGVTSRDKVRWLVRHVRDGHLVFARQSGDSDTFPDLVAVAVAHETRHGLVEVLSFGEDAWEALGPDGAIDPDALQPRVRRFEATNR